MSTEARAPATGRGETLGGVLVGSAALLFGMVVIFGKKAENAGVAVPSMLALRFGAAAAILAAVLLARRQPLAAAPGERAWLLLLGSVGYAAESACFFAALPHGTAAAVTLLFFTYPVFVTVASWALGRGAPNRLTLTALACAVGGAAVVVGTGSGISVQVLGAVLAFSSALLYTAYLIGADHVIRKTGPLTTSMWVAAAASAGLVLFAAASGQATVPEGWRAWGPILGMGTSTAAAFVCLMAGLRRLGPVRTSIVSAGEPLAASLFAFVFLGESVRAGTAVGGVLILIGAITASLARAAAPAEPPLP